MNLILFEQPFEELQLPAQDERAKHIRKVLRAEVGTKVFVGFVNGLRARSVVTELPDDGSVHLQVIGTEAAPEPLPISLLLGLPRPHTAKRILFESASMGVSALHFFESLRSEPSYAHSSLWSTNEWRERLRLGTEQSFGTHVPEVSMYPDLQSAISRLHGADVSIALDNYEAQGDLTSSLPETAVDAVIALGAERGWSPEERDVFRKNGWKIAHMGAHVLRAETAVAGAVAATSGKLGWWREQTVSEL